MTLTLIVMRHAKSGWDDPSLRDHARTLTDRGHRDAKAVGRWLLRQGHVPDLILSSDAMRTGQTVADVIDGIARPVPTQYLPAFYNASADTILRSLHRQTAATIMVCAHNPGIADLAHRLVRTRPDHSRMDDYPTAATTVLSFATDTWADIKRGDCRAFVTPADLKAE